MKVIVHTAQQIERAAPELYRMLAAVPPDDFDRRHFVLAPDRYTQTFERQILERLPAHGAFQTEVFSFRRLLFRLKQDGFAGEYLSAQCGIMVLRKLVLEHADELTMQRSSQARGFAENLYDLILKLKFSCPDLDAVCSQPFSPRLKGRMADIRMLYDRYREFLAQGYYDSGDLFRLLPGLCTRENLAETHLYLVGFDQFNYWEKRAVVNMARNSASLHLFCSRIASAAYEENNEVFEEMTRLFDGEDIPYEICSADESDPDVDYFFRRNRSCCKDRPIVCYRAAGCFDEVQFLAEDIRNRVLTDGLRYRDICVTAANPDTYESLVRKTFADYGIPCFTNPSYALAEHPLANYLLCTLRAAAGRFEREAVLRCVKNPFFEADTDDKSAFENYCLQFGAEWDRFLRPFDAQSPELEAAERVRSALMGEIQALSRQGESAYGQIAGNLLRYLESEACEGRLAAFHSRLQEAGDLEYLAFSAQAIEKLRELLLDVERFLKDTPCLLDDFCNVLENGMAASRLSLAPTECDSVTVGDLSSAFFTGAKCIYVIGLQEGFPPPVPAKGLLSDADVDELNRMGANLLITQDYQLRRKKVQALQLCCSRAQLVYTCVCTDTAGLPSVLTEYFQRLKQLTVLDRQYYERAYLDEDMNVLAELVRKKTRKRNLKFLIEKVTEGGQGLFYSRDFADALYASVAADEAALLNAVYHGPAGVRRAPLDGLFFRGGLTSISVIETYYTCPYKHFLRYGLRPQLRPVSDLKPVDIGSFLHKVAELFVQKGDFQTETDVIVSEICQSVAQSQEFQRYFASDRQLLSLRRIQPECIRFCDAIKDQLLHSRFASVCQEAEFNLGARFDCIELPGLDVRIRGKIDRIDRAELGGVNYVRIIDYKSGNTKYEDRKLYSGEKIQLMIYLYALTKDGSCQPAGVYYFPIHDKFRSEKNNEAAYQLRGYTLRDYGVFEASDDRLRETGKSRTIAVTYGKDTDGLPSVARGSKVLTREQFDACMTLAQERVVQAVQAVRSGSREIHPTEGSCDYCEYLNVCKNYRRENVRAVPKSVTPDNILELINGKLDTEADH